MVPSQNEFTQRLKLTAAILPGIPLDAIRLLIENQVKLFTRDVLDNPHKVIWTNMVMPVEIFYAAGLIPLNMELAAGWLASLGLSEKYISLSESIGFSPSLCSYHKAAVGLCEKGCLPPPQAVCISSHICDGAVGVGRYFAEKFGAKNFILHLPYHKNTLNTGYVLQQYRRMVEWLEGYIGRRIREEDIAQALELSNIAREYWLKANELRKGELLFQGYLALRNLFGTTFLFGSKLGVEVAKAYYNQLLDIKNRQVPGKRKAAKKKRILWVHFCPLYANKVMEYLEEDLNCSIVFDITGHIYWPAHDTSKPLESLAERSLSHFYLGEGGDRRKLYSSLIKEFNVEGIIHFMHNGCRAIPGSSWLVNELAKSSGLPYLELSGDCIDPRGSSEEQMRLRLEAFSETLGRV